MADGNRAALPIGAKATAIALAAADVDLFDDVATDPAMSRLFDVMIEVLTDMPYKETFTLIMHLAVMVNTVAALNGVSRQQLEHTLIEIGDKVMTR